VPSECFSSTTGIHTVTHQNLALFKIHGIYTNCFQKQVNFLDIEKYHNYALQLQNINLYFIAAMRYGG